MTFSAASLARVESELTRIGLLMQHDAALPSVTTLVAGQPIRGSWWGHPRGQQIYELLTAFEASAGQLSLKLVAGKITHLHVELWPALLTLSAAAAARSLKSLSKPARELFLHIAKHDRARLDELAATGFAPKKALLESARVLEQRSLVHTGSVHTAAGAHAKELRSWLDWAGEHAQEAKRPALREAREQLESAVARLAAGAKRTPRVALLDAL